MHKMTRNWKIFLKHTILFIAIGILVFYGCPVYNWFGICCPLCGTTRAWLCFLRGDVEAAFYFHPLFLITPFWFFVAVHYGGRIPRKRWSECILLAISVLLAVINILRLIGILPSPG
jgi:uncharacterized membrane protein